MDNIVGEKYGGELRKVGIDVEREKWHAHLIIKIYLWIFDGFWIEFP